MTAPAFNPEAIPVALKAWHRWIVWKLEDVGRDKPAKVPYRADGEGKADTTDPATWSTFDAAAAAVATGKYDGVGFVFTDTNLAGVDLDDAFDGDGGLKDDAAAIVELLDSYTERSQSGKGLHVVVEGKLPEGRRRRGKVETYDTGRYFALTGDVGERREVRKDDGRLAAFHARYLESDSPVPVAPVGPAPETANDDAPLRDRILASRDGKRFHLLYYVGESDERRQSEADWELACILCRATTDDAQVERMMRASALKRPKWTTHRTLVAINVRNARIANPAPAGADAVPLVIRSLREAVERPPVPPAPVVPLLAWARRITLVAALDGLGKSTLFRAAAAAVTTGGLFLGARAAKGPVLWVLAEEPEDHLVAEAVRFGADPDLFRWIPRSETPVEDLAAAVAEVRPTLVVIDTVHAWAAVEEASQGDSWREYLDALKAARDTGAAVLLSAEAVKSTGDYADSRAIAHAIDVRMVLRRPDLASPRRTLEVPKSRVAGVPVRIGVALAGRTYDRVAAAEDDGPRLTDLQRRVLDAWRPGATWRVLADALDVWREPGPAPAGRTPKNTFNTALKGLVQAGALRKDDETGAYARDQFLAEQEHAA